MDARDAVRQRLAANLGADLDAKLADGFVIIDQRGRVVRMNRAAGEIYRAILGTDNADRALATRPLDELFERWDSNGRRIERADLPLWRALLRGETVSSSGRFVFRDARVALRPAEAVDFWVGASAPPAIDRAARLTEGWLASPSLTLDDAALKQLRWREVAKEVKVQLD